MKCPFCGSKESKVVDSRDLKDETSIRRRRECLDCGQKYTTYEYVEKNPMYVINVDNNREPFDFNKLWSSIEIACSGKDMSESPEEIAKDIEKKLLGLRKQEISTMDIVEIALEKLKSVEPVTSVVYYTQHTDCKDFASIRIFINKI